MKLEKHARVVVALVVAAVAASFTATASAATITVNTTTDETTAADSTCSLREAIATVNGNGNGDCAAATAGGPNTIVLGADTYPLTLSAPRIGFGGGTGCIAGYSQPDDNTLGELLIAGTVQNLTIEGAGAEQTLLDACKLGDRALEIKAGASVTLRELTITNGHAANGTLGATGTSFGAAGGTGGAGANGGGILNQGALTMIDTAVTDSHAGDGGDGGAGGPLGGSGASGGVGGGGGGIANEGGTLTLSDSTVSDNSTGTGGHGGDGTKGSNANGQSGNGGSGGNASSGGDGGGIFSVNGPITITGSTIADNTTGAGGAGGAGQNADPVGGGAGGNGGNGGSGGGGAGMFAGTGNLQATNDTIADNTAGGGGAGGAGGAESQGLAPNGAGGNGGNGGGGGGALLLVGTPFPGVAALVSVTVAGNAAGTHGPGGSAPEKPGASGIDGDGGGLFEFSQITSVTLKDTLLYENEPGSDCSGAVIDGGHNLIFSPPSVGTHHTTDACAVPNFLTADPVLQPLADNGGPTQTMRLGAGSAAIGAGAGCQATDQRGVARSTAPACDIGAYELTPPAASTPSASAITQTAATLTGSATAKQASATTQFEYGTSTNYGSTVTAQTVGGLQAMAVSAPVTGLAPGTTYHFRLVVTSLDGTTASNDASFTTASAPPQPTPAHPRPPQLTRVKIHPSKFKQVTGRHPTATIISYRDSRAARTTIVVFACAKKCRRLGRFTHTDKAGANRVKFTGRLGTHALKPGRYELRLTSRLGSAAGKTVTIHFRVTDRRP
jgi:CSLREA domain-containing protein